MENPKIPMRRFSVDKRWGHYVLRVNVWDELLERWEGWRDASSPDLPIFFEQLKPPTQVAR